MDIHGMSKELWSLLSNIKPSVILQVPYNNAKLAISPLTVQHRDHILQRRCYLPTGKYSALQHLHSTKVSPRHLLCPGTYGNILVKEPGKDLSTTVTLATFAYRCRSGIDRNCFLFWALLHKSQQRSNRSDTCQVTTESLAHSPPVQTLLFSTTVKNTHRRSLLGNN